MVRIRRRSDMTTRLSLILAFVLSLLIGAGLMARSLQDAEAADDDVMITLGGRPRVEPLGRKATRRTAWHGQGDR